MSLHIPTIICHSNHIGILEFKIGLYLRVLRAHTHLCTRLSVNVIEANAEKVLLSTPSVLGQDTDIIADTSRFQVCTIATELY